MKFHKLVKSIDYATYPVLVELRRINRTLGNSLSRFRDILISTVIGILLDISPVSQFIIDSLFKNSHCRYLVKFSSYSNADTLVAILLAGLVYFALWLWHFIKGRWGSNKNTINERKEISFEFYKVVIPNLISLISIIEQADDSTDDEDKRVLLLFQAKHELEDLINILSRLNVIEIDAKTNILTQNSRDVLDQIGQDAYFAVLIDIIDRISDVYNKLKNCTTKHISATLDSIRSLFISAHIFSVHSNLNLDHPLSPCVKNRYEDVKKEMSQRSIPAQGAQSNATTH